MNNALQTLITRLVDYAGLFPPAKLPMRDAVENFSRYRTGPNAWMLARFIAPVSRLEELEAAADEKLGDGSPWLLSVLPGPDLSSDLESIGAFNERNADRARIDTIEAKAYSANEIAAIASEVPDDISLFVEVPIEDDPGVLVAALAESKRCAKIRTGGVTPEAFPPAERIIRFIRRCHEHDVPFKATAGLHHPLRCVRPLTYEIAAPTGAMNGFVNLFLGASLLRSGAPDDEIAHLLAADDAAQFTHQDDAITWRDTTIDVITIEQTRRDFAISFGSCSFEEPVDDLRGLGWLD